ncbi:MAG: hypothetical protein AAGC78_19515 [Cellvibrio sp.]|uniref:hypothetical protein n=1 Tax=Cellvibrio sp. TaxID=1965322 RepID=UPI0031AEC91F
MFLKICVFLSVFFSVSGCSAIDLGGRSKLPVSYALEGTSTAVVGIAVDKKTGIPKETVREIVLIPGQKVIFAGPDQFLINFKNRKAPNNILRYKSENGVIKITIPRDILDDPKNAEEFKKNKYLRFDYSIIVNGKELDPPIIIKRDS